MHTRTMVRGLVTAASLALTIPLASTAHAAPTDRTWSVDASTYIKNVNQTVAVPTGTLNAQVDTATGKLTGNLALPNATKRLAYQTIPLADVTVGFTQAAPVTGTFDTNAGTAKANATFNVRVVSIRPVMASFINLVNGTCQTKSPNVASLSGALDLGGTTTLNGSYRLSEFQNCGNRLVDTAITAALSGKGNTMSASLS